MQTHKNSHHSVDYFEDLTGEITVSLPKKIEAIGSRIKTIRESKGLSLGDISNLTGFGVDLLSSIESEDVKPPLGTVAKLSKALDSAFSRIVSGTGEKLYSITRKNEEKSTIRAASQKGNKEIYTYHSLAPDVKGRHMEALIVELNENPEKEISVHDGEEFIYVLEGGVIGKIGDDEFELKPGDSIYYLSTTPHLVAAQKGTAKILAVIYE
ncbi:MAG: XRE family transcriptional regulator [Proteobacteria bacterium]|nr:XRE family transcriptional regulator [Pseudomonadota bacterium]